MIIAGIERSHSERREISEALINMCTYIKIQGVMEEATQALCNLKALKSTMQHKIIFLFLLLFFPEKKKKGF